jgi:hypothetical protein
VLEGQNYRLKNNQAIIIPPLFYHSVTANGEGSYHRITALFGADAIPGILRGEFAKQGRCTAVDSAQMEKVKDICQKQDPSFYAPLLQSLMIEIFYDALLAPQANAKTETDEFLQKAFEYIELHLKEKILLEHIDPKTEELTQLGRLTLEANESQDGGSAKFHQHYHNDFYQYLRSRLMIQEDIESLKIGTEALAQLQHARREYEELLLREEENAKERIRDRRQNLALAVLSLFSLFAVFMDLNNLIDVLFKTDIKLVLQQLQAGNMQVIAQLVIHIVVLAVTVACVCLLVSSFRTDRKDKHKK